MIFIPLPWLVVLVNPFDEDIVDLSLELIQIFEVSRFYLHRKTQQSMLLFVLFENLFVHWNLSWNLIWVGIHVFVPDGRDLCTRGLDDDLRTSNSCVVHQLRDDFIIDWIVGVGIEAGV